MTQEERENWLGWVHLTSIPLLRFAPDESPIGIASGCLVNYQSRRFILTVSHAVKLGSSDWAIAIGIDEKKGIEIYRPSSFLYVGEMRRGTAAITEVDYCYAEVAVDIEPTFQRLTPLDPKSEKVCCHVFDMSEVAEPQANELFAFSGQVHPELHGTHALVTEPTVYPGLRYTKSEGPFHEFTLPVSHPGHDSFHGCSGAPIVDTQRHLVALVSSGDDAKNVIYGVSLTRYRFALDFYCKEIRPA